MKRTSLLCRFLALTLALCLFCSAMAGCGALPSENESSSTQSSTAAEDSESSATEDESSQSEETATLVNTDKSYIMSAGFTKPSELSGNFFQFKMGTCMNIIYEGMFCLVRSTDTIVPRLCESYEDEGNVTTFHLRQNAAWSDGEPFTARDIKAYFDINNGHSLLYYLDDIAYPDDYTIQITWKTPRINPDIGMLIVADGWHGTIAYHVYQEQADRAGEIIDAALAEKRTSGVSGDGPYGVVLTDEQKTELGNIWNDFLAAGPDMPIGTGPYMIESMTDTDMILVKNPYYYDAENVDIEKVVLKNLDNNTALAMLSSGQLDSYGGILGEDMTDSMLASNPDLRFYPMFDPACQGMYFNLLKAPFDQLELRQAIAMIINKTPVRQTSSIYSKEYPSISSLAIVPSTLNESVSADVITQLKDYTYNLDSAETLLTSAGWSRNADGIWQDKDGKTYEWTILVSPNSNTVIDGAAVIADQMNKFGFQVTVVSSESSTYYDTVQKQEHDMVLDLTDVSWSFVNPYSVIKNYYTGDPAVDAGLRVYGSEEPNSLILTDYNGEQFDVYELIDQMYWMDEQKMQDTVDRIVWATNENAFCVNLYQQTVGTWQNAARIGNLPMEDAAAESNHMPLPESLEDRIAVAKLNLGFAAAGLMFDDGVTAK